MPSYQFLKPVVFCFLFIIVSFISKAQHGSVLSQLVFQTDSLGHPKVYKNELKFSAVRFIMPHKDYTSGLQNELGISYERKILKHWSLGIGYYYWRHISMEKLERNVLIFEGDIHKAPQVGDLYYRVNYKMFDVTVGYFRNIINTQNVLSAELGISYIKGTNEIISFYTVYPQGAPDALLDFNRRKIDYIGIVPQINYDHLFLKNRVNAGFGFKRRIYFGWSQPYYELAAHLGVNF